MIPTRARKAREETASATMPSLSEAGRLRLGVDRWPHRAGEAAQKSPLVRRFEAWAGPVTTRLSKRTLASLYAVLTILATLLVACGGGGERLAPAKTATETPLARGTPIISDNRFEYPARGYGVEIPEGWEVDADYISGPGLATDAFFAPEPEVAGAKASIVVARENVEANRTADSHLDAKMEVIRQLSRGEPRLSHRGVAGVDATAVEYEPTTADVRIEKTDVIFVQGTHVWTISLTVPAGQMSKYQDIFDRFLASYHILEE
jgi:hypothetical protein